jgi:hypothetical protein
MCAYDPVTSRVRPTLLRLQRETAKGKPATFAFATLCRLLSVPSDLHTRLLLMLVGGGYVTEEGGELRLTEAGAQFVAAPIR